MQRRAVLALAAALIGTACSHTSFAQGFPSGSRVRNLPPEPRTSRRSNDRESRGDNTRRSSMTRGCLFASSSAGAMGFRIVPWTGNPVIDQGYQLEGLALSQTFQVAPSGAFMDDSLSPNAMATPERLLGPQNGPDGTVIFGMNLITREIWRDGIGMAVAGIMAHEFAHIRQFKRGSFEPGRDSELEADFLAGWYLDVRQTFALTNVRPALQSFFEKGDYAFNDPLHHGTPQQRLDCVLAGISSGARSVSEAHSLARDFVADL